MSQINSSYFIPSIPSQEGMSAQILLELLQTLETQAEIHSIVILRNGKLVLEGNWNPFSLSYPQMMHSLSKLGIAICMGYAVYEGKLTLQDHFIDYVREDLPTAYDPSIEKITIEDLLTMRAGSSFCANNVYFTSLKENWETNWLEEKRIPEDIGSVFHYDSGCSYTLSLILSRLYHKTCLELLDERVFRPMGLSGINWLTSPEGASTGGWGMYLNARQIAALGQLLLQNGSWNGKQLIPAGWVTRLSQSAVAKPGMEGRTLSHYGYHMHKGANVFAVEGAFEQLMLVFEKQQVVVAITAGTANDHVPDLCEKYILEAIRKGTSPEAGEEEDTDKALDRKLRSLALPLAPAAWQPGKDDLSQIDPKLLSGRWIRLEDNPRKIHSVSFSSLDEKTLLVRIKFPDGSKYTLRAGTENWISNDVFTDFTRQHHCLSYALTGDSLYITDCMIDTSYREEYMFQLQDDEILCGWKPNVTYLDGGDTRQRHFRGHFA